MSSPMKFSRSVWGSAGGAPPCNLCPHLGSLAPGVASALATAHPSTCISSLFCLFSPPPLELVLLKAGPTRRVNVPRGNSQPIGDKSHGINTPVSQSFAGKILTFALRGVLRVLRWVKVQLFKAATLSLAYPLLCFLSSLFCSWNQLPDKIAVPRVLTQNLSMGGTQTKTIAGLAKMFWKHSQSLACMECKNPVECATHWGDALSQVPSGSIISELWILGDSGCWWAARVIRILLLESWCFWGCLKGQRTGISLSQQNRCINWFCACLLV